MFIYFIHYPEYCEATLSHFSGASPMCQHWHWCLAGLSGPRLPLLRAGHKRKLRQRGVILYGTCCKEQEELHHFLEGNLRKSYIIPLQLLIASPVFFIKKKDGKLCLVIDY
jgi:hypothetical protein